MAEKSDEGQQNLLRAFLEAQVVYSGRTPEEAANFVIDVLDEWLGSGVYPLWRTFNNVDGYSFTIKITGPGKIDIHRKP